MSINIGIFPHLVAQERPGIARDTFDRFDQALNATLPGSDTHERYASAEEVGLAAVLASGADCQSYDLLDPTTPGRLAFMADNRREHPGAWTPKETDEAMLGAPVPEGMGRFTAFAIAKLSGLEIAGFQFVSGSRVSVSGLWEVHDHVVAGEFGEEVLRTGNAPETARTADGIAADLERTFHRVGLLHEGTPAAALSRDQVSELVKRV